MTDSFLYEKRQFRSNGSAIFTELFNRNLAMKIKAVALILTLGQLVFGQTTLRSIEGKVLDKNTNQPIPYANIFNASLGVGTITNQDGYFRVDFQQLSDSISVSFIGYETAAIPLNKDSGFYAILLQEREQLLGEVVVTPKLNTYLYGLLADCTKKSSSAKTAAKAYYELKTFRDTVQVELVESFFNIQLKGYDLADMALKTGRLAMQPFGNRFFVSMESSMAITRSNLKSSSTYYPSSPLDFSKRQMQKKYSLHLEKKYLEPMGDSVYVIGFEPVKTDGTHYEGTIWLNKTKQNILKVQLRCSDCLRHPFRPMFGTDSIASVGFNITKTFEELDGEMVFKHVDFAYAISYKSRVGKANELAYTIKTNALLYAYDFGQQFDLPIYEIAPGTVRGVDYRAISAMPYNEFFWKNNDEYRLNEAANNNEIFFSDPKSVASKTAFTDINPYYSRGFFEHPFKLWSKNRVKFREVVEDTSQAASNSSLNYERYKLSVKIFVDINTYKGATDIKTATIFDPYESYFHLPIDSKALCFINLFFDLCEVERRKLDASLRSLADEPAKARELAQRRLMDIEAKKQVFLQAVKRGTNETAMEKWNSYVWEELGIDNISIFKPFSKNEND